MSKTIAEYQADMNQADRVRRLKVSNEFETLQGIVNRMKQRDIDFILAGENAESRHRIHCLNDLMDEIEQDIQRGDLAAEALKNGTASDSPADS